MQTPPHGAKAWLQEPLATTEAFALDDHTIPRTVLFPDLFEKPLVAMFDQAHASSDGGAVLLSAADQRLGVTAALRPGLADGRTAEKVTPTMQALVSSRVFGIACGYPDANDADRLADDPIQKLLLDRDPTDGVPLASPLTISRFDRSTALGASREEARR